MPNKQTWGYDQTKKMLSVLRTLNESKRDSPILKEEIDMPQNPEKKDMDLTVVNNVEVKLHFTDPDDLKLSDDEKNALSQLIDNFRKQVVELAEFEEGFNIKENEVRLDGTISDQDISFTLIAGDNGGAYINSEMLKLDSDIILTIQKLEKFYHTYADSCNELILNRKTN